MSTALGTTVARHHHIFPGAVAPGAELPVFRRLAPFGGEVVAEVTLGTREDVEQAISVARREFDSGSWSQLAGQDRTAILLRWAELTREHLEEIARIEVTEVGKPIASARGEVGATIQLIERAAYAGSALVGQSFDDMGGADTAIVRREPVGVVGAIIPWNFPGLLFVQKVAFALAAGNTVVAKPSEFTSGSAIFLTRLAHEAGVPETALTLVTGLGQDVGQPLAESTDVDVLTFTGSTATANVLASVKRPFPQRQHLELGGKGATIVFADADLDAAVDGALFGFCINQGETCTAGTRLLVQRSIADEFLERLAAAAARLKVGNPWEEDTQIGPMIHAEHHRRVRERIALAVSEGARIVGDAADVEEAGSGFVPPTILGDVQPTHAAFQQEIFGPVLAVTPFDTADEALELANGTMYGLANSVWTADVPLALRLARRINSGTVWINAIHADRALLPFGGNKASGFGREKAQLGVEEFTQLKTITIQLAPNRPFYG